MIHVRDHQFTEPPATLWELGLSHCPDCMAVLEDCSCWDAEEEEDLER